MSNHKWGRGWPKGVPSHSWTCYPDGGAFCEPCGTAVKPGERVPTVNQVPCVAKGGPDDRRTWKRGDDGTLVDPRTKKETP